MFQYRGYTFYKSIIHKNQPHICKIQGRPRPGAVESLAYTRPSAKKYDNSTDSHL